MPKLQRMPKKRCRSACPNSSHSSPARLARSVRTKSGRPSTGRTSSHPSTSSASRDTTTSSKCTSPSTGRASGQMGRPSEWRRRKRRVRKTSRRTDHRKNDLLSIHSSTPNNPYLLASITIIIA